MLNKHLKIAVRPVANAGNIVRWRDYRVTVLTGRLFRIERGSFNDRATQAVWFRDMQKNDFSVTETDSLSIDTGAVKLVLKEPFEDSRVIIGGKSRKISNEGNLLGTYRTLDNCIGDICVRGNKKIELGTGVCSKTGVAVLDDGDTLLIGDDGELIPREPVFDKYVFAYGNDYRAAVKALYLIEGEVPMIPRYALGNWWSRYYAYTDREYIRVLNRFEENGVPLTVATIDMDWHYSDNVDKEKHITELGRNTEKLGGNNGWTGYSWNKNLFPDYKAFLKEVASRNLAITLNVHPADGVRWWEDMYEDFAKALGKDPASLEKVPFDLSSAEFINKYFEILHRPYERDGVTFWWIDWQQGEKSGVKNLDPLWALNHYHYLDNAENHAVPMILSRYCGAGAHRYPLGFSGDTDIGWKTLEFLPYFTLTASNIGYTWWSHDIGGHHYGAQDEELYVRFAEFGVFNPINRLHSTWYPTITKEPWFYPNGCGEIVKEQLRFRHKLIPYLYSAAYRTHTEGIALVEPMYYDYPREKSAYACKNQYMFGGQLLVAPITRKGKKDGYAAAKVWLPKGLWTDIFTGESYIGGKTVTMLRTLESIPVLAKEGAVLPLCESVNGNGCALPETLRVKIFAGDGDYTLYEDGAFTHFGNVNSCGKQSVKIKLTGKLPVKRNIKLEFIAFPEGAVEVTANGAPCDYKEIIADNPAYLIENISQNTEYTVTLFYEEKPRLTVLKENALRVLKRANGVNEVKRAAYECISAAKTEEEFVSAVKGELPEITVKKIFEIMQ